MSGQTGSVSVSADGAQVSGATDDGTYIFTATMSYPVAGTIVANYRVNASGNITTGSFTRTANGTNATTTYSNGAVTQYNIGTSSGTGTVTHPGGRAYNLGIARVRPATQ